MNIINFEQFMVISEQLDITLGLIETVERVEKSDKMLKLTVNFGEDLGTVMTNIGNKINPEDLVGKTFPFVTNLEPVKIMGIMSTAMIMVATKNDVIDLDNTPGSRLM
jgi:methionyl-tRNA synthetase